MGPNLLESKLSEVLEILHTQIASQKHTKPKSTSTTIHNNIPHSTLSSKTVPVSSPCKPPPSPQRHRDRPFRKVDSVLTDMAHTNSMPTPYLQVAPPNDERHIYDPSVPPSTADHSTAAPPIPLTTHAHNQDSQPSIKHEDIIFL